MGDLIDITNYRNRIYKETNTKGGANPSTTDSLPQEPITSPEQGSNLCKLPNKLFQLQQLKSELDRKRQDKENRVKSFELDSMEDIKSLTQLEELFLNMGVNLTSIFINGLSIEDCHWNGVNLDHRIAVLLKYISLLSAKDIAHLLQILGIDYTVVNEESKFQFTIKSESEKFKKLASEIKEAINSRIDEINESIPK